jgi:hypothetical protein
MPTRETEKLFSENILRYLQSTTLVDAGDNLQIECGGVGVRSLISEIEDDGG